MEDIKEKKKERKQKKIREEEGKNLFESEDLSLREATSNNNHIRSMNIQNTQGFTSLSTKS